MNPEVEPVNLPTKLVVRFNGDALATPVLFILKPFRRLRPLQSSLSGFDSCVVLYKGGGLIKIENSN